MKECDLRFSWQTVNGIRLHCAEAGPAEGPVILLLHGFPEFWFSWRHQLPALAKAGFHAVAPDLRGYNLSDKPRRIRDYSIEKLVGDVVGLIENFSPTEPVVLVGHDWGGIIAWYVAMWHPKLIRRLVILNAPHPMAYRRELLRPWRTSQWWRSWYVLFFQIPRLPEAALRRNNFAMARRFYSEGPAGGEADVAKYIEAISRPGALSGMINYYRAAMRSELRRMPEHVRVIDTPTLLIWGDRDEYLDNRLTLGLEAWVTNLKVQHLPEATHWVQHDAADQVNHQLLEFLNE